ncbi:MAG: restriction endonuclease subunit S [Rhizobiales bacterium]|nr:restriction endonuclease subunit S [Hyphomicrobiales bacterium]NRB13244.1 restriction endonuclease subunit S [Hyphomicrobiales bacterium]
MSFIKDFPELIEENKGGLLSSHRSWQRIKLSCVSEVLNGYAFKSKYFSKEENGFPLIRIRDVVSGKTKTFYEGPIEENYVINSNDLLVGMDGDFNSAYWKGKKALLNQRVAKITPNENFYDKRFLGYTLPGYLAAINAHTSSVTVKHLSSKTINDILLPLPAQNEQKRIVDKVDALFARSGKAKEALDTIPALLDQYRQSILAAAFRGDLTKDDQSSWDDVELADICNSISDGDHQAPPKAETGIPFITISAMNTGKIKLEKATRYVPQEYYDNLKPIRRAEIDDILFSVTGSIAIPALVLEEKPFVFQRHIAIIKPNKDRVLSKFLVYLLDTQDIKEQAKAVATGTAQVTVPLKGLRSFNVKVPSLEIQTKIVGALDKAFQKIAKLKKAYDEAYELQPKLNQSILAKAFRGGLVPQDPSDEPASELLKRIKAEREEKATKPKEAKKKPKVKKAAAKKRVIEKSSRQLPLSFSAGAISKPVEQVIEKLIHGIETFPGDTLQLDELQAVAGTVYDDFKVALFEILQMKNPPIQQVFDGSQKGIMFKKVSA